MPDTLGTGSHDDGLPAAMFPSTHSWSAMPRTRSLCQSTLLVSSLLAAAALPSTVVSAQVAYVDTQGREWRQVKGTTGHTWDQIAAVCPTDGATECSGTIGGLDLTGWVWATDAQVAELFSEFVPLILEDPSFGGPNYALPAMFFFGSFQPTFEFYTTFGGYNYVSGWTSTAADGTAITAEVGAQWNPFNSSWSVAGLAESGSTSAYRGIWLVHLPPSNEPADLDGDGSVNGTDLALVLGAWGDTWQAPEPPIAADLDGDGIVGGADIAMILGAWTN